MPRSTDKSTIVDSPAERVKHSGLILINFYFVALEETFISFLIFSLASYVSFL